MASRYQKLANNKPEDEIIKRLFASLLVILTASLIIGSIKLVYAHPANTTYRPKNEMIDMWKSLCDANPDQASYEIIGQSVQGRDIYLFKVGNPNGGKLMMDASGHGDEDAGAEISYVYAEWLLTSSDPQALRILNNNYNLFIPVLNMDSYSRTNMRRTYTEEEDGLDLTITYGVDLSRNAVAGWGRSGSGDPDDDYSYRGPFAGSEPETQAWRYAAEKYRPAIYLNQHQGAYPSLGHVSHTSLETDILNRMQAYCDEWDVEPYQDSLGGGGGTILYDADVSFGASGWIIEIYQWWTGNEPNLTQLISQYYPRVKALYMAMANTVEITDPQTTPSSNPTPTPTPTPTPSPTPKPTATPSPTPSPTPTPTPTPTTTPRKTEIVIPSNGSIVQNPTMQNVILGAVGVTSVLGLAIISSSMECTKRKIKQWKRILEKTLRQIKK